MLHKVQILLKISLVLERQHCRNRQQQLHERVCYRELSSSKDPTITSWKNNRGSANRLAYSTVMG